MMTPNQIRRWQVRQTRVRAILQEHPDLLEGREDQFHWVPMRYKLWMLQKWAGVLSPARTRKLICLECKQFSRRDVGWCADQTCPHWATRPYARILGSGKS